jgi:hypothetical protein
LYCGCKKKEEEKRKRREKNIVKNVCVCLNVFRIKLQGIKKDLIF